MSRRWRRPRAARVLAPLVALAAVLALACTSGGRAPAVFGQVVQPTEAPGARPAGAGGPARVLLVTATAGFHHDSNATARAVIKWLGEASGAYTTTTLGDLADLERLNAELLAAHDAVFFANTSGELPLDDLQKRALLDFVAGGGGFVGTHSATDTLYTWPEYGRLIGAYLQEHPWTQRVTVAVEEQAHPLTRAFGGSFEVFEEIYVFRTSPRPTARVLLRLDAGSVGAAGDAGADVPLAWCARYGAGRVFYNALGHFESTWEDGRFQQHLLDALRWAAGRLPAACEPDGARRADDGRG